MSSYTLPRSPKTRAASLASAALALMNSPQGYVGAIARLERDGDDSSALRYLKSATAAMSTGNTADLINSTAAVEFIGSLSQSGMFDALRTYARRVPLATAVAFTIATAVGSTTAEGKAKPLASMSFELQPLEPLKALALVAVTREVLRSPFAADAVNQELRTACVAASDATALPVLIDGAPSVPASGTTASAFRHDLGSALAAMNLGIGSRVIAGVHPALLAQLACLDLNGADLGIDGGEFAGVLFVRSGASEADSSGSSIVLVDAAQIAVADGALELKEGPHATLQMDSAPTDPPTASTVIVSMWQQNKVPLLCERWLGVQKAHDTACALITGAAYRA